MLRKKFNRNLEKTYPSLEKYSLNELFTQAFEFPELAASLANKALVALLELDYKKFNELVDQIHDIESRSDDVHDYIVQRLYGREVLVFSRADRLFIINELDDFVDNAQEIVFNASTYYPPDIPNTVIIRLVNQIDSFKQIGSLLKEALTTLLKNFNATLPIISEIESIKSMAHREHLAFLKRLFELDLNPRDFFYYEQLERKIWESIYAANKFADGLRRLIFKYRI